MTVIQVHRFLPHAFFVTE